MILSTTLWLQTLGRDLAVSKREAQKFHKEIFNPKKLSAMEVREVS